MGQSRSLMVATSQSSSCSPVLPPRLNTAVDGMTFGELSARKVDLHRYRTVFPDRWAAFLKANFPSNTQAAAFFDRDEATIRNWKSGKNAPRAEEVTLACDEAPGLTAYLRGVPA